MNNPCFYSKPFKVLSRYDDGKPCGEGYISEDFECHVGEQGQPPLAKKMPKKLNVSLQEHQKRIAEKLKNQRGLVVYHGLGSGKTIASINAAEQYGGAVVVTPASLQDNFRKELKKTKAKGKYEIYSYEKFSEKPPDLSGKMLIIDEAHRLKTANTKRTKSVLIASQKAEKVLALTGTPIQNKPHDIAPLINIVSGEKTLDLDPVEFNKNFIERKKIVPNIFDRVFRRIPVHTTVNPKNLDEFNQRTAKYVDYYVPTQKGFPTLTQQTIEVPMSKEQVLSHRYWSSKIDPITRRKIQNNLPLNKKEAEYLNVFVNAQRQIANTDASFNTESKQTSPKIKAVVDRIAASKGRNLIYSNYLESGVNQVSRELEKRKISHKIFTGALSQKEKARVIKEYNEGRLKALIVSSSGGEGLDLKKTRHVHILEPHWNDEKINQVIGRAARYKSHDGLSPQEQTVNVYRYISKIDKSKEKTADQYLEEMSRSKQRLNDQFLSGLQK